MPQLDDHTLYKLPSYAITSISIRPTSPPFLEATTNASRSPARAEMLTIQFTHPLSFADWNTPSGGTDEIPSFRKIAYS